MNLRKMLNLKEKVQYPKYHPLKDGLKTIVCAGSLAIAKNAESTQINNVLLEYLVFKPVQGIALVGIGYYFLKQICYMHMEHEILKKYKINNNLS